jgi:hypothetical protein
LIDQDIRSRQGAPQLGGALPGRIADWVSGLVRFVPDVQSSPGGVFDTCVLPSRQFAMESLGILREVEPVGSTPLVGP